MPSANMLTHLQQNVTFLVPVWKMTSTIPGPINPINITGGSFTNHVFTKSAASIWGNSGFFSGQPLIGDGYIEWRVTETTNDRMVGLSTIDTDQNYTSIQYAWDMTASGTHDIYESGVSQSVTGSYVANTTVFRITRTGTNITYHKNGVLMRTVGSVTTAPLYVDTAVQDNGGTIGPILLTPTVKAYAAHTRNLTFGGVTYFASPVEPTRFTQTIGLEANHVELFGVFDDGLTEEEVHGGKWKNAPIQFEYVVYDPATGALSTTVTDSVGKMKGQAGKFNINNGTFTVEFRSLADLLSQEIGEMTSPVDRLRRPEDLGVSMGSFTHARAVTAVSDRMNFTVNGSAQADGYFQYGRAEFTSGANSGLEMEIKNNTGNVIELQLPIRSTIAIGDAVTLIAGYDGTREQARDKFAAAENMNCEPDLPGLKTIVKYPE